MFHPKSHFNKMKILQYFHHKILTKQVLQLENYGNCLGLEPYAVMPWPSAHSRKGRQTSSMNIRLLRAQAGQQGSSCQVTHGGGLFAFAKVQKSSMYVHRHFMLSLPADYILYLIVLLCVFLWAITSAFHQQHKHLS